MVARDSAQTTSYTFTRAADARSASANRQSGQIRGWAATQSDEMDTRNGLRFEKKHSRPRHILNFPSSDVGRTGQLIAPAVPKQ